MSSWFWANWPNNCAKSTYHSVNPHAHWENHENHYTMEWAGYMPFWPVLLPIQKTFGSPYHVSCPNSSHAPFQPQRPTPCMFQNTVLPMPTDLPSSVKKGANFLQNLEKSSGRYISFPVPNLSYLRCSIFWGGTRFIMFLRAKKLSW